VKEGGGWGNWMVMLPWYQLYDPNSPTGYWMPSSGYNPLSSSDPKLIRDDSDQYQAIGNAFVKWDTPIKGLSVKGEAGVDLLITNSSHWRSIHLDPLAPFQNEAAERSVTQHTFNYTGYLNYDKTLGSHNFNITAGSEATRSASYNRQVEAANLLTQYPNLINPLIYNYANGSFGDGGYLMGLFGRANYKFKDRYILNASIRRDGHSVLSKDNRWATFTALGAGWIITDEEFFNVKGISLLKLRGSYGQTGNTALNKEMTQINWGLSSTRYGGSYLPGGTTIGPIGSTDLKWETTSSLDFGLDYGFFDNRISGSVAYYTKDITDLILKGNVQESVGFNTNSVWENIGDMKNWGWELNMSTINVNKGGFNWKTDFNISFNDNEIVRLNEFEKGKGTEVSSVNQAKGNSTIRKEGEKLDTWYLANFVQIDPDKGIAMIEQRDQAIWDTEFRTVSTGTSIPMNEANVNANKMIQHGKSALPTFYGGITNNFSYRNFDLNVQFVFAGGNYIMNYLYSRSANGSSMGQIAKDMVGKNWEKPGDIAQFPQLVKEYTYKYDNAGNPSATGTRFNTDFSTFYLEKGDYVKLRNLQLGYTLPKAISKKIQLQNVRLYIGGSNLLTLTKFRGFDPESSDDLPLARSFNFGCSVNF
jgi:TonB-linked SusC/RagA family outer membrane protein